MSVLFLGSSHLSAIKLAYDALAVKPEVPCSFFCARGADFGFTEVIDGKIKPLKHAAIDKDEVEYFFREGGDAEIERYSRTHSPMSDVEAQFTATGGAGEIDLHDVSAVFYVAGTSPYDFCRLGEEVAPISPSLRRMLLSKLLRDRFLLRHQINAMRVHHSQCKHYFIGSPLFAATQQSPVLALDRLVVAANRDAVRKRAAEFLFDAVFEPPEYVLNDTLLSTKWDYIRDGKHETVLFQRGDIENVPNCDVTHMNRHYGAVVWETFIAPILAQMT